MRFKYYLFLMVSVLFISACADGDLPKLQPIKQAVWLEQNWSEDQRDWFHHATQGTWTFFVPYEWFIALEQPGFSLFARPSIADDMFLQQLGFIPGKKGLYNAAALPVGFVVDYGATGPDGEHFNAIGLTCAACHTGQMTYKGTGIRYDGGPSMISADKLMSTVFISMFETYSSKRQFKRFAANVLGERNTDDNRKALRKVFAKTFMQLIKHAFSAVSIQNQKIIRDDIEQGKDSAILFDLAKNVKDSLVQTEGYARTDALNRIGNQVFALDADRPENFAPVNAPVSFPFIWNSAWFLWVQYDGSIMQPMIRNAGESLGVGAFLRLDGASADNFSSSAKVKNLHDIETLLAGTQTPFESKQFSGLTSPRWPEEILGGIDHAKAAVGEELYRQYCQQCHLPPVGSVAFWDEKYWSVQNEKGVRLLDLPLIPVEQIGTDPNQSRVLAERTVNTKGMGINTQVFAGLNCDPMQVTESETASYAFSLGAVVQETVNHWYAAENTPPAQQQAMNGALPNCLQASKAYKARPLNGIWATAPFLHNGSVPDLYALLSPVGERPTAFYVGNLEFDPLRVGYVSTRKQGLFLFDVTRKGNSNKGHEFNDTQGTGVIGPLLSPGDRGALVEFLKTL